MHYKTRMIFQPSTWGNIFGNALEWYDFALYGSLAPFIAQHFFPAENKLVSLMLTFAVFAIGFIMRPLGGVVFGHLGDRQGRRKPLLWSVALMVIPTILIGLVPSFGVIGFFAPVLIVLIRLFQGLSVGGEFAGSMVYLSEISDRKHRGFFASFATFGIFVGLLLGPLVILGTKLCVEEEAFSEWGWRIPFLFSIPLGVIVFFWRHHMQESVAFIQASTHKITKPPLQECVAAYKAPLWIAVCISAQVGIPFWLVMIYSITYFTKILHAPYAVVEAQNLYAIVMALLFTPFFGWLTTKIAARKILMASSVALILMAYVMNVVLIDNVITGVFYLAHFFIVIILTAYLATFEGVLTSLFPPRIRYSGIALSYNSSLAIFGGTAPLIVTALIKNGLSTAPGIVLTAGGMIAMSGLLFIKRFERY